MGEAAAAPTTGARVLVVDDEPSITDAVATALRYEGYETMEVGAGRALADDYVTKPFSLAEIVARVQSVLRRTRGETDGAMRFADLTLDEATREVRRGDQAVELTRTEFELLRFLMLNPRRVLTKRQILDNVWHYDFGGDANVVETYISYLRKKLDPLGPPLIQTVRLVGYALRES